MNHKKRTGSFYGMLGVAMASIAALGPASHAAAAKTAVEYKTVESNGVRIFYREAGPKDAPAILLLHGFPSSSRMFATLIERLGDRFHLIAPDYPGFGHSETPSPEQFAYTFEHLASVMDAFTQAVGLSRYAIYLQDYGGPVGIRLAIAHPERVTGLIVQNAVFHEEGLSPLWAARRAYWSNREANETKLKANLISLEAARLRHLGSSPNPERYDPDLWTDEAAFLNRPGQDRIQADLFYDYRTNVASYPAWQAWLRQSQPRTLIVWGRYDPSFDVAEVEALKRDLPNAEAHILDAGHFAADEAVDTMAPLIATFLSNLPVRN